ncbi:MAG TPA: hypothetical protein VMR25_14640, partial [Planctomycetaceae bacterium]|nr:hypothetical protein [Planctomycetaceae bacterium]
GDRSETSSGDTTIIPRPAALDSLSPPPPTPTNLETPRHFRSIAEEAADIIRRHKEMIQSQRDQG